jgi:hypothetical protein
MSRWLLLCALPLMAADAIGAGAAKVPDPLSAPGVYERLLDGANKEQWRDPDFEQFSRELIGALSRRDATAVALLTAFPLRLNFCDGSSVALENETALQNRFDEAFPAWLRSEVDKLAKANDDSTVWGGDEVGIAHGLIWTKRVGRQHAARYRVRIVNVCQDRGREQARSLPRLLYACETEKHRIVIDADKSDMPRYRAWNKPRFLPDPPDITMRGTADILGTSGCAHSTWSFVQGKTRIAMEELKCTAGTDGPPDDARAQLVVLTDGKPQKMWWCY